ncbi:hypothetical protein [Hydrogenophaga sp.]|uniref:hypothetical protein n=1 Tax=Hydrogenophaga sp. TaxID=1904254 RepID=UPI0039198B0E
MSNLLGVIRTVTIPVLLFDHLKQCQRQFERQEGRKLTNSQALAAILRQHRDQLWPTMQRSGGV